MHMSVLSSTHESWVQDTSVFPMLDHSYVLVAAFGPSSTNEGSSLTNFLDPFEGKACPPRISRTPPLCKICVELAQRAGRPNDDTFRGPAVCSGKLGVLTL